MRKGRFSKPVAEMAQRYSESVSFDRRLFRQDIAGSIVHAAALEKAGIISPNERRKIDNGLRAIEREIETGKFRWDLALEDVHMNIEAALTKRIGAAGGKLHTARSRNDQIALDLRLYVKVGDHRNGTTLAPVATRAAHVRRKKCRCRYARLHPLAASTADLFRALSARANGGVRAGRRPSA